MSGIVIENVTKIYPNGYKAIENLNLNINDKKFIVLVGPSGCGKSTLLRMIAGLEEVTDGKIYINDRDVTKVAPKDRNISMVFQSYALYPHMNIYDNMAFPLLLRKVDKKIIRKKIEEISEKLEINDILTKYPNTVSGGQKQRVALGRAIIREPDVFLFDEPLSNLDAKLRASMRIELIRLHKQLGTTFVYVTHDQTEAMTMGEKIVVMKDGFIQQVDAPIDLYKKPKNIFTAGFIGTPQMNFISDKTTDMTIGIRPEKISLLDSNYNSDSDMIFNNMELEAVELLGAEKLLYFKNEEIKLVAKISEETEINTENHYNLYARENDIHRFNEKCERI